MVNTAEQTALNAEAVDTNSVGLCLVWCRERAGIAARDPSAAAAWARAERRHLGDRDVPRGAFAFWTGGSEGFGHIAIGLGGGLLRSTDADGPGRVATRDLAWFDTHFTSLTYAGWADNVNGVTVPGVGDDMADAATQQKLDDILAAATRAADEAKAAHAEVTALRGAEADRAVATRQRDAEISTALDELEVALMSKSTKAQIQKIKQLLREHVAEPTT